MRVSARVLRAASVRVRLTLWYTLVLAATVIALGAALYFLLVRTLAGEADSDVSTITLAVARAIGGRADDSSGQVELQLPEMTVLGDADTFVQVVDLRTGEVLGHSANQLLRDVPPPLPPFPTTSQSGSEYQTYEGNGGRFRIFSRPVFINGQLVAMVQAARSLTAADRLLERLRLLLAIVAGLGVPTTAAVGWGLAGRALAPIGEMTRTAERIGRDRDFSQRLGHRGPRDELEHLARTINVMLAELESAHTDLAATNARLADTNARLERSLAVQTRFVADASHELRTPLTTIRANADVLRWTAATDDPDHMRALADLASEAERMSRLVEALLVLARADFQQRQALEPTQLKPLVEETLRHALVLTRGQHLALESGDDGLVLGKPDALRQLLLILVDNALKYTPAGGRVTLRVVQDDHTVRLTVADTGIGISPQDIGHIFEPFYRADTARETDGSGLGLAIARSIVNECGGRFEVTSQPGLGSTFVVVLPAVDSTSCVTGATATRAVTVNVLFPSC